MQKSWLLPFLATLVMSSLSGAADVEWVHHGNDAAEQRFSELSAINTDTVTELGLEWQFEFPSHRVMEATPLVRDGVMYTTTAWSTVYALDARTGTLLWSYDPEVPRSHLSRGCCGPANRGVALWQNSVIFGTYDGRLISLDAESGSLQWETRTVPEDGSAYTITAAPRVVDDKVIIGNGGAEFGVRGYVSAYSAATGQQQWRFYTVPGNPADGIEDEAMEMAMKTWSGRWWEVGGGGGTVWDSVAYDADAGLLYIGTGNGSPWNREIRSPGGGDNLFLSSIVALNASTGEYQWHYQTTPAENWDYTATQHIILADIEIKGEVRKVLLQAPKNGFFYVIDRLTGELLSAEAYANVSWAMHVDMYTGRPVETELANYQKTGGSMISPAPFGAHNWQPMAFSPDSGLVYIPKQEIPSFYAPDKKFRYKFGRWNTGTDLYEGRHPRSDIMVRALVDSSIWGELLAWDPVAAEPRWQIRFDSPANGGILATAGGLVFQGRHDGQFVAYDADDGEQRWSFQSDSNVLAAPISFSIDGEQYVAVSSGRGGALMMSAADVADQSLGNNNRMLVFKLGAKGALAAFKKPSLGERNLPLGITEDVEQITLGNQHFHRYCATCHGMSARSSQLVPDLRYLSGEKSEHFTAIVMGGIAQHKGMPGFADVLDLRDVEAVRSYLYHEASKVEMNEESLIDKAWYWFYYAQFKIGGLFPALAPYSRDLFF